MRQKLINTLKLLEKKVPPPRKCHHSLTYNTYGPDRDELGLHVNIDGCFVTLFLQDDDFDKTPETLVDDIILELDKYFKRLSE